MDSEYIYGGYDKMGRNRKQKRRVALLLFIVILITAALGVCVAAEYQAAQYADNVLRLHVIANSNTSEDQALKLKVRDTVGSIVSQLSEGAGSAAETEKIVRENIDVIENAAEERIRAEGYSYSVRIETGNYYFPTKYYTEGALPAGEY